MAYQSLYRRYRPATFGQVLGQDHVVAALRNAVRDSRAGHAYLFSGPRGTGKTSTARILARALNCTNSSEGEPCNECESCTAVLSGHSYDLQELDAASNNGVEAIRDLIVKAALGSPGNTKVYILDEVHMLTTAASNALLKILEEPPSHVTFVLATTDPQKVLETIRSRTQHLEFGLLPGAVLEAHVRHVIADAELEVDEEGIAYVLRRGGGSARDTLSALDQVVAAGGSVAGDEPLDGLLEALCERDTGLALLAVNDAIAVGRDPRVLGEDLLTRLRDAFLSAMNASLGHLTDSAQEVAAGHAKRLGAASTTRALEVVGEALIEMRQAPIPRIPLEVALVRLTRPEVDPSPAALLERIERLEQGAGPAPTAATPAPLAPAAETVTPQSTAPSATSSPPSANAAAPSARAGGPAAEARRRLAERQAAARGEAPPAPAVAEPPPAPVPVPEEQPLAAVPEPVPAVAAEPVPPTPEAQAPEAQAPEAQAPEAQAPEAQAPEALAPAPSETAPAPVQPAPIPVQPAGAGGAANRDMPTLEELSQAWADVVLAGLRPAAKAMFSAGRFVEVVGGKARYGLPNEAHRDKADNKRPIVEEALQNHFGRRVPLELVVAQPLGSGTPATNRADEPPKAELPTDQDIAEIGDVGSLDDADVASNTVDRLTEAFPGAELVEDQDGS